MKTFAPFLKLYTEYVKNFDNAMTTINLWLEKSPKFASIMEELQVSIHWIQSGFLPSDRLVFHEGLFVGRVPRSPANRLKPHV